MNTTDKAIRNAEIIKRRNDGVTISRLTMTFQLSRAQISTIVKADGYRHGYRLDHHSPHALLRQFNAAIAYLWQQPVEGRGEALRQLAKQHSYPTLAEQLLARAERPDGPLVPLR